MARSVWLGLTGSVARSSEHPLRGRRTPIGIIGGPYSQTAENCDQPRLRIARDAPAQRRSSSTSITHEETHLSPSYPIKRQITHLVCLLVTASRRNDLYPYVWSA